MNSVRIAHKAKQAIRLAVLFSLFASLLANFVLAYCPLCIGAAGGAAVASRTVFKGGDLIFGLFVGGFSVSVALWFNRLLLKKNNGKSYFPAQGIVLSVASVILAILTFLIFYSSQNLLLGTLFGALLMPFGLLLSNLLKQIRGKAFPFQSTILPLLLLIAAAVLAHYAL